MTTSSRPASPAKEIAGPAENATALTLDCRTEDDTLGADAR